MNQLTVGSSDCPLPKIVCLIESTPDAQVLFGNWKKLARLLETPIQSIDQLQQRASKGKLDSIDIIHILIDEWTHRNGDSAKLTNLLAIFQEELGLIKLHGKIWETFHGELNKSVRWDDLDKPTQDMVLDSQVALLDKNTSLKECLTDTNSTNSQDILRKTMNYEQIMDLLKNETTVLANNMVPPVPKYHIPISLRDRCRLDKAVFDEKCPDIFVIDQIRPEELSEIAKNEPIGSSSTSIGNPSIRFMSLDSKGDFQRIAQLADNVPIHLLTKRQEDYYWRKTKGSLKVIQKYVHKKQGVLPDTDADILQQTPISIADKTGMGKTVFLSTLCNKKIQDSTSDIAIYFSFAELMMQMSIMLRTENFSDNAFVRILSEIMGRTELGRELLFQKLLFESQKVFIFLNGYDEISSDKLELANAFLIYLVKNSKRFHVYVGTRLHRQECLERVLNSLTYSIVPFDIAQQCNFLEKYWHYNFDISNTDCLRNFARLLISSVGKRLNYDNFGVPLLCAMLGDIYAEDAKHNSTNECSLVVTVDVNALYNMCKEFIAKLIDKRKTDNTTQIRNTYTILAVKFLNPGFLNQNVVNIPHFQFLSEEITRTGVLKAQGDEQNPNVLDCEFTHQVFCDLLLAELVVEKLVSSDKNSRMYGFNLLLEGLQLVQSGTDVKIHTFDCCITDIWRLLCNSKDAENIRNSWTKLATKLELTVSEIKTISNRVPQLFNGKATKEADPLFHMLYKWTKDLTTTPLLEALVKVLDSESFHNAADSIKSRFYRKLFRNSQLAFLLDAKLLATETTWANINPILNVDSDRHTQLYDVLQSCLLQDYPAMFRFFSKLHLYEKKHMFYADQNGKWSSLICDAAKYARPELVYECIQFVEKMTEKSIYELQYEKWFRVPLTPLHAATQRGDYTIFNCFFKKCQNVSELKLLLHCCTLHSLENNDEILRSKMLIISNIVKVHKEALEEREVLLNRTPLIMERVHYKLAVCLLNEGADGEAEDEKFHQNVAHRAALYYSSKDFCTLVSILLKGNMSEAMAKKNSKLLTPLEVFLQKNRNINPEELEMAFLEMKANPALNIDSNVLMYSAVVGLQKRKILQILRNNNSNEFETWDEGKTYPHIAAQYGNLEALGYFASLGCNINEKDDHGMTPLHFAIAQWQNVNETDINQVVTKLVKLGADIHTKDKHKRKACWYAQNSVNKSKISTSTHKLLNISNPGKHLLKFAILKRADTV